MYSLYTVVWTISLSYLLYIGSAYCETQRNETRSAHNDCGGHGCLTHVNGSPILKHSSATENDTTERHIPPGDPFSGVLDRFTTRSPIRNVPAPPGDGTEGDTNTNQRPIESCTTVRRKVLLNITNCRPQHVYVTGCRGSCSSRQRADDSFQIEHSNTADLSDSVIAFDMTRRCRCCQEIGRRRETIQVRCSKFGNPRMLTMRQYQISQVAACECKHASCETFPRWAEGANDSRMPAGGWRAGASRALPSAHVQDSCLDSRSLSGYEHANWTACFSALPYAERSILV